MKHLATRQNSAPDRPLAGAVTGRLNDRRCHREVSFRLSVIVLSEFRGGVHATREYKPAFRHPASECALAGSIPAASIQDTWPKYITGRWLQRPQKSSRPGNIFQFVESKPSGRGL